MKIENFYCKINEEDYEKLYIVSDTHFGHGKIINFANRHVFSGVSDMNRTMIENWNDHVSNDDYVLFLGDFAWDKPKYLGKYLDSLNGKIIFIRGNHDLNFHEYYEEHSPKNIYAYLPYLELDLKFIQKYVCLFHYPQIDWNRKFHGSYHFYGHVHINELYPDFIEKKLNVGVDNFARINGFNKEDYRPYKLKNVIELIDNAQDYIKSLRLK